MEARSGGSPISIDAAELIEQYAVSSSETLLILDEDTPYEEQLHLVLVRRSKILDHIVIGAPYTAGIFRFVDAGERSLQFQFESDAVWIAFVKERGSRGIGGLPPGASRRRGLLAKRYLALEHKGAA
ncbi:MAG: hypothetical protein QNJ15_13565 [Erythrobacter sp.]|nr:hypothetical protein [Erythrobacter sp.]